MDTKDNSSYKQDLDAGNFTIGELGEKGFLDIFFSKVNLDDPKFLNGLNQDAGIVRISDETLLVSNVDKSQTPVILSEDPSTYQAWGYLAVTSSLSDVAVVGGKGISFLLSLTIPDTIRADYVLNIIQGAKNACEFYQLPFVGGDTKKGKEISVVGISNGIINNQCYLTRNGSKVGDYIIITNTLGNFASISHKINNDIKITNQEIEYVMFPKFDNVTLNFVSDNLDLFSASMDNSDGLNNVLRKMLSENNLNYKIDLNKLPYGIYAKEYSEFSKIPIENFAFYVGDWNSVFTISKKNYEIIKNTNPQAFYHIGEVIEPSVESYFYDSTNKYKINCAYQNDSFNNHISKNLLSQQIFSFKSILDTTNEI